MPLTLNVGLTKKIGLPDYGSLGASCHVAVELDQSLLQTDLDGFHERVQQAFTACRQAVNDELARQQPANREDGPRAEPNGNGKRPEANGRSSGRQTNNGHRATAKQLDYAEQLAKQVRGLGKRGLEQLAQKMYGKPISNLSGMDASGLIDTLKAIKAGEIDVNQALNGGAA
ncbi:MAG: hypothetical protein ACREHD_01165 [Pirellulales bacterium]